MELISVYYSMAKLLIVSVLFVLSGLLRSVAQTMPKDSLIKAAQADVKRFKLSSEDFKQFRKNRDNYQSDLFKPTPSTVADTTMLRDSVIC